MLAVARPRGVRHGDVPPLPADDGRARGDARELPHRPRPRLRQPRPEGAVGIERSFEPWNRTTCCPTCSPRSTASSTRLAAGIDVADIGCGAGGARVDDGRRVPEQQVRRLRHLADSRSTVPSPGGSRPGSTNVRFVDPRDEPIPDDGRFGFVTTFDCIHDMTAPAADDAHDPGCTRRRRHAGCSSTSRRATRSPRTWPRTRWPPLMYGISVLSCMSSAMSAPDGAGLGTLGLPGEPGRGDGRGRRLRAVPPPRHRPLDQRVLRGAAGR